ncbi:hypothetical protein [Streptomyces sp. 4N509B]|uniref:hypothetical protein n=1 Tax=Streptomyces sp. 4N509B TaxID=3457413 RepID=UPI003FD633DA
MTQNSDSECEEALLGEWACSTLNDIPGVNWLYGKIGDAQRATAEEAVAALEEVVPDDFIEQWVTGMAESTVSLLSHIQALGGRVSTPAFDQRWWSSQYATSFGLSLLLLAFLLVWITARLAASGSSASATDLFRQSGWRLVFVVPLISAGPPILLTVQVAAHELARSFAEEGQAHAGSAVEGLMELLTEKAGDWGAFGGTVLALLLLLFILCLGLVTLIEMAVAQWGLHLGALLVPLALVAWVYPPWSGMLRRLVGLLGGLLLLPSFVYFFFTTIWTSFDALIAGGERDAGNASNAGDDGLSILLFLTVGLLMIDAFPLVAMWLMSLTSSSALGMDPDVRGVVRTPSAGEMAESAIGHVEARVSQIVAARGTGGSDDVDDGADRDDAPADPGGPADPGDGSGSGQTSDQGRNQPEAQQPAETHIEPATPEPDRAGPAQDLSTNGAHTRESGTDTAVAASRSPTYDDTEEACR